MDVIKKEIDKKSKINEAAKMWASFCIQQVRQSQQKLKINGNGKTK